MGWFGMNRSLKKLQLHIDSFRLHLSGQIAWHMWLGPGRRFMTGRSWREMSFFTTPVPCRLRLNVKHKVSTHKNVLRFLSLFKFFLEDSFLFKDCWHCKTLMLSEKATCERIKKRGPHHPLTRDSVLLRVGAIQRAQCVDEVSINMERNARLRDSWGPLHSDCLQTQICPLWHTHDGQPRRATTCVPSLRRSPNENLANTIKQRNVTTAPDTVRQHRRCLCSQKVQPQNPAAHRPMTRVGSRTGSQVCDIINARRSPSNPEHCAKPKTSLPKINHF